MLNRKYLLFLELAKQLGRKYLAQLFRGKPAQKIEHDFDHLRLLDALSGRRRCHLSGCLNPMFKCESRPRMLCYLLCSKASFVAKG